MTVTLGFDFGTSGARAVVLASDGQLSYTARCVYPEAPDMARSWRLALETLLDQIPCTLRQQIQAIAVDGTSGTVLITNAQGEPVVPVLGYNDARAQAQAQRLTTLAPRDHVVTSPTSSLAKLLWYLERYDFAQTHYFLHQADWLGFVLHGQLGQSDEHNALKLGFDVVQRCYPQWFERLALPRQLRLPRVHIPGTAVAEITSALSARWQIPAGCRVMAGTTDSIAAFLASGATQPGEAVTSLGSTLVLKLLSTTPVTSAPLGIYSHRLGELWLVGGASNTGGAVLKHFFSASQLHELSQNIDPQQPSPYDYYPLLKPGERFPVADPHFQPRLEPRPIEDSAFLQGLLEGMARIEAQGYRLLQSLGATPLQRVYSAGGGASNEAWTAIRARHLGVTLYPAAFPEAAVGTATLARRGLDS